VSAAARAKGAAGENEAIKALAVHGIAARRTASMQAGRIASRVKVPDLLCDTCPAAWIEVKRTEAPSAINAGIRQAAEGCDADPMPRFPLVLYRENRKPWVVARPFVPGTVATEEALVTSDLKTALALVYGGAPAAYVVRKGAPAVQLAPLSAVRAWLGIDSVWGSTPPL